MVRVVRGGEGGEGGEGGHWQLKPRALDLILSTLNQTSLLFQDV